MSWFPAKKLKYIGMITLTISSYVETDDFTIDFIFLTIKLII
jgi:hypothetical protein